MSGHPEFPIECDERLFACLTLGARLFQFPAQVAKPFGGNRLAQFHTAHLLQLFPDPHDALRRRQIPGPVESGAGRPKLLQLPAQPRGLGRTLRKFALQRLPPGEPFQHSGQLIRRNFRNDPVLAPEFRQLPLQSPILRLDSGSPPPVQHPARRRKRNQKQRPEIAAPRIEADSGQEKQKRDQTPPGPRAPARESRRQMRLQRRPPHLELPHRRKGGVIYRLTFHSRHENSGKLRLKFSASPVERADRLLTAPKLLFRLLETAEPLFEREQFRFPLRQRGSRQRIPRP